MTDRPSRKIRAPFVHGEPSAEASEKPAEARPHDWANPAGQTFDWKSAASLRAPEKARSAESDWAATDWTDTQRMVSLIRSK